MSSNFSRVWKKRLSLCAIVLSVFALTSCSLYEGPKKSKARNFGQGSLGCMKDFKTRLNNYLDGHSTPQSVDEMAVCATKAVQAFRELARGENRGQFTATEMRDFLQRYFLEDIVITDDLLKEFMRVKQAFIGGKASDFTPADLDSAEEVIETVRTIFRRMQPAMPISIERLKSADPKYAEILGDAISGSADIFAGKITENATTYSFEDMGRLLEQTMRVFKGTEMLGQIRDNLGLAGVLKEMLVSSSHSRSEVTAMEWKIILQDGGRWVASLLKLYQLQSQPEGWLRGPNRSRFGLIANEMLSLTVRFVDRHCPENSTSSKGCRTTPGVPLRTVSDLIDASGWDGKVGNFTVTHNTMKMMINVLVLRVLGGADESETGRNTDRITRVHVERLRSMLQNWLDGSRYLEGAFAELAKDPRFGEGAAFSTAAILKLDPSRILLKTGGISNEALKAAQAIRAEISKTVALEKGLSGVAVFDSANATRARTYRELSRYTWLKPAFDNLVTGYVQTDLKARTKNISSSGLKQEEFANLIGDFWGLLVDFELVNYRNNYKTDASKRFREAALFTQTSDGNDTISVSEGMQLILYMLSTDPLSKRVHARAVELCGGGVLDLYGQPTVNPECYRKRVWNFSARNREMNDLWSAFPTFMRFYDTLTAKQQQALRLYIQAAARKPEATPKTPYGSDDSQSSVMILHYVETLFMNFDKDHDSFIDQDEASKAFPTFARVLGEMAKMEPSKPTLKSVFFWVLTHGAPPVDDNMGWWRGFWSSLGFLDYDARVRETVWGWGRPVKFKASRLDLFKVFATLSAPPKTE